MNIGNIKIWPVKGGSNMKAKADITLITDFGEIAMKGFRIVQVTGKGPFVAPPQEKYPDRSKKGGFAYKDILWLGQSFQQVLYPKVLDAFNKAELDPQSL